VAARKQLEIVNNQNRDGLITYLEVATAESTALKRRIYRTNCEANNSSRPSPLVKAWARLARDMKQ